MSIHGNIDIEWGGATRTFRIGLREVRELQEKTGVGPLALFRRIDSDDWFVDDIRETLRIGLVGGEMKPSDAITLLDRNFDRPVFSKDITINWGDGPHKFRLSLKDFRSLKDNLKVGLGPMSLFHSIQSDSWRIDDLREPIRLGLITGGMEVEAVNVLMDTYFDGFPKIDQKEPAIRILAPYLVSIPKHKDAALRALSAFLIGDPNEQVGKPLAAGDAKKAKKTVSPSPRSMVSEPSSASLRTK